MFGNFHLADRVASIFSECRREFIAGIIIDERDYVSNLTSKIRQAIKNQLVTKCFAQTLPSNNERKFGVDGIMIFKSCDKFKVGIFEAKRPKVKVKDSKWDKLSTRKISHLSEQIVKQRIWKDELAVWEMFFNEAEDGFESPPYDYFGSSCVWHEFAYFFMHNEDLIFHRWTTEKLKKLLKYNGINLYFIIYDIISCRAGKILKVGSRENYLTLVTDTNPQTFLEIPILPDASSDKDKRISEFLLETGIQSYLFIDLSKFERRNQFGI